MSGSGPLAATITLPTAAFAGNAANAGPLISSISLPTASIAGTVHPAGGLASSVSLPVGVFAGSTAATGGLSSSIRLPSAAFVGGIVVSGPMAATISLPTARFADGPVGVIAASISLPTGAASGWVGEASSGIWLHIHTTPAAQVYALDGVRGRLNPYLPTHRIDDIAASPLQSQIGRVNESWAVTLTGCGSGLRSRLAQQFAYGVRVQLFDGGDLLQEGITDGLTRQGRALELSMQADAWTRDLPIRTTADLGTYRDVEPVAWRFGRDVPGELIPLSNTRKRFVWADHASVAIRSIMTGDGQPVDGWTWRNDVDSTGRPITIVETVEALEDGETLIARGDGAKDSVSGELLTNPSDIVREICRRAGREVSKGTLARFRRDCLARGLELSHSIDGGTLQAAIDGICASVYAVFARSHRQMLRLLPITGADAALDARYLLSATSDADSIATRLLVRYGSEEKGPRRSLEVRANAVELARGERSQTVTLGWIRDDRSAADVATRMLEDLARPSFRLPYSEQLRQWVPGEVATVSDPDLGLAGDALVESVNGKAPTCVFRLGNAPTVTLGTVASAYTPEVYALGGSALVSGGREFTINDSNGRPAVGARCTLDGGVTRTTDGRGIVSFPSALLTPGPHTIVVIFGDIPPYPLSFTV